MPYAQDTKTGVWWEVDAQGNPIRPAQQGQSTTVAPSPARVAEKQAERERQAAADARAAAADARAAAAADREARDYAATHYRDGSKKPTLVTDGKPSEYQGKSSGFYERMLRAEKAFADVPEADRGPRGVVREHFHESFPNVENSLLNSSNRQKADQAALDFIRASLRQESGAAINKDEEIKQYKIFYPMPGDSPEVIAQKAEARRVAMDGMRIAAGPLAAEAEKAFQKIVQADAEAAKAKQHADNEVPGQITGAMDKPPPGADGGPPDLPPANMPGGNAPTPPTPASGGGMQTIAHPEINSMVQSMLAAGAGYATINAALKQKNASPISFAEYNRAKDFMAKNPGQTYPVNATEQRPLSMLERFAGSAPGAFVANAANSATAGIPVFLAGDQGKGAIDAMNAMNPGASLAGNIVGGVTGAGMGEAALTARAPLALAKYAPRIADSLYGGISGFTGADPGNRVEGAVEGAILAPLAGAAGERTVRAVGSGLKGVTAGPVQYLRGLNIPLTVGQAVGQSGRVGAGIKKVEDAMTAIPGVGNVVDARRREGLGAFNKAAFDIGAETTGDEVQNYGAAGLRDLRDLVGQSYSNALDPVTLDIAGSPTALADITNAQIVAHSIPKVGQDAADAITYHIGEGVDPATGMMSGRDFQEAYRGLGRTGRKAAPGDYGHEFSGSTRMGQDALATALEDQNPGAYQGFLDANAANRRMNILADALGAAKNQEGGMFTPAQLNAADFRNASNLTGKVAAASGDRPFAELAEAGQGVLPSKLPDSGTSTRALVTRGLTGLGMTGGLTGGGYATGGGSGAGTGAEVGLGSTALLMALGTKAGQRALVKLVTDRPDLLRAAGKGVQSYAPYIGGTPGAAYGALLASQLGQ